MNPEWEDLYDALVNGSGFPLEPAPAGGKQGRE